MPLAPLQVPLTLGAIGAISSYGIDLRIIEYESRLQVATTSAICAPPGAISAWCH